MPEDYTPSHYTEFCPACSGYGKIHYHPETGDNEDDGRFIVLILVPLIAILTAALVYGLAFR